MWSFLQSIHTIFFHCVCFTHGLIWVDSLLLFRMSFSKKPLYQQFSGSQSVVLQSFSYAACGSLTTAPASDRPLGSCAPLHHLLTWFPQSSSASRQPSWSTPSHLQCMQPIRWKQAAGLWGRGWEREKETSLIVAPLRLTQHLNPLAVLSQRALKPLFTRWILAVATHSQGEVIELRKNSIPSVRFAVDCVLIFPLPSFFVFLDSFFLSPLCWRRVLLGLDKKTKQKKTIFLPIPCSWLFTEGRHRECCCRRSSYQLSHHVWSDAPEWRSHPHYWQDHTGCPRNHLPMQLPRVGGWRMAVPARAQRHLANARSRASSWR